jgi:signal peptidase I
MKVYKRRSPLAALVLSLLTPGLGQLYNGQIKKATILYFGGLSVIVALALSELFLTFRGMVFSLVIIVGFFIFSMVNALYNAARIKEIQTKRFNRWYVYLIVVSVGSWVVSPLIKSVIPVKAYKIPAGSMEPALLVGDHIVVNKKMYEDKQPARNDIVVFPYPEDRSKDFIKRVIGTPGDKIQIQDRQMLLNGQLFDDKHGHHDEKIVNLKRSFGPVVVPKDHYFVLGDNRDHSFDSRFWGFVPFSDLKGKALYIYWAKDKGRIGKAIE